MKFTRQIPLLLVLFFIPYLQASVNPKLKIDFKQNTNIIFQKNENFLNNKSRTNSSADFELHCTPNVKIPSCRTQNQVDSLFEIWLSGASISGGCKSFLTVGSATSPDHCGGITTAHFTAYSECDSTLSCDATFEVESASPLTLACPEFVVESSCQSQNTIELKFNNWIQSAIISGGCSNPKYFNFQYTHLPSHCGDSVLTTINTLDQCYTVLSCTSTFVVTAADSAILTCPTNQIVDTGHSQTEIDSLFFIWKNSATYSGACNLELSISMGEAPKSIGGATIVSYQLLSDCSDTLRCNSKFKVVSILPVTLFCPENAIEASCQTQSAIDLKFAAWKKQASFTGGCDAILTSDNFTAPNSCGGSISLTFTVNSDCEELLSCTSSFTIQSAPPSSLNCPVNVVEDFNQTQQTIDEKFSTWKTTAQFTGGCNGILSSSNGIAPSSTGGTTNVKFTLNNDCDNEKSCTARFSVRSANNFSLKCPGILIERSCQSQDTIDEKFESWISTATFMGGCNAVISNNRTKNPSACGDTTVITFTVLSDCDSSITCIDTFIVEETLPVVLNCPNSVTELACQTQSTIDAKYNAWIQSVSVTGGCNNFVIVHGGLPPNACGGIASIIFEDTSSCQALISCTSTFNVTNAPNIALTCPAFVTESACQTQAAIDAKFAAWKNTVSFIGGCNGVLSNSGNTSPNACGGVENVTFSVTSDCQTPVTCVATFKVTNAPTIALTCPTFVIENACQTQAAIDAKFAAWKNTASFTGGCNGVLTNNGATPPKACGSNTLVNFIVTSSCESTISCNATFSVLSAPTIVVTCPLAVTELSCQSQATIDAKFNVWKKSIFVSGGCNSIVSSDSIHAPSFCGGDALVTFTVSSDCEPTKTCNSQFKVSQAASIVLTCPANITINGSDIQKEIDDKFLEWKNTASFSGGCNSVQTNNAANAPSGQGGEVVVTFTVRSDCDITKTCTAKFTVKNGVYTTNLLKNNIDVYPNPASNFIIIKSKDKSISKVDFDLVDINGKIILQRKNFNLQIDDKINIENVNSGTYITKLKNDKSTLVHKIEILR